MQQQLNVLLVSYIATAKDFLDEASFAAIDIPRLQKFCALIAECMSVEHLTDTTLARHGIEQLQENSVEEAVMHVFLLAIYCLSIEGSHPLERGLIRQKIIGILPIFEQAVNKGLIKPEIYDRNADALLHIANNSDEIGAIHEALAKEYLRLAK
jgi:hypothetical protein